jgi:hypothetical protein
MATGMIFHGALFWKDGKQYKWHCEPHQRKDSQQVETTQWHVRFDSMAAGVAAAALSSFVDCVFGIASLMLFWLLFEKSEHVCCSLRSTRPSRSVQSRSIMCNQSSCKLECLTPRPNKHQHSNHNVVTSSSMWAGVHLRDADCHGSGADIASDDMTCVLARANASQALKNNVFNNVYFQYTSLYMYTNTDIPR